MRKFLAQLFLKYGIISVFEIDLRWKGHGLWSYDDCQNQVRYTSPTGITVTPGSFITDLGSTPRFVWSVYPPEEFAPAYIIHDWLCNEKCTDQGYCSRKEGDKIFYNCLIIVSGYLCGCRASAGKERMEDVSGVKCTLAFQWYKFKCWTIYKAVRIWAVLKGLK